MKKTLALLSSMLIFGVTQVYAADPAATTTTMLPAKIAVVNVQQVFQQSPKIASLNKELQSKFKPRQDKLIAMQKSLQDELDKYKKESSTMSQKDQTSMQKKIGDDQATLQKDAASFQEDLNKEQSKVMKSVLAQLNQIITDLAKKNDYTLVLDSQAVIYAVDASDITKQVAKEFDAK